MNTIQRLLLKRSIVLILLFIIHFSSVAQPRQRFLFDFNWNFKLGDAPDATILLNYPEINNLKKTIPEEVALEKLLALKRTNPVNDHIGENISFVQPGYSVKNWKQVNLPHDWAVELPINPKGNVSKGMKDIDSLKGTSIGWYRKTFSSPVTDKDKIISIELEGVYRNALFWINGHCLGRNVSGYIGCQFNISQYLNYGGNNTIVVRVDASHDEGWWYEGAGIYRHVWLVKTQSVHVAHWGTFAQSAIQKNKAVLKVETQICNEGTSTKTVTLSTILKNAQGKYSAHSTQNILVIEAGKTQTITQLIEVKNPILWNIETPYLYTIKSIISQNNKVVDEYNTIHGFRTLHFDKDSGFYLNGKRTFLKGVCVHQDHAGVGTAIPDKLEEYRLLKLKEMGVNAYRTSHNPQSPYLYESCDRLGILVMDENRRMSDDNETVYQLKNMIIRDRNHPSVILWSLGNEEEFIQGTDYGLQMAKKLQDIVHSMDSSRLVTEAMNANWGEGISKVIEVQGFNYLRNGDMDTFRKLFPDKPAVATEEGSTHTTRGVYVNDEKKGYISSYLPIMRSWSVTPEQWLQYYASRPWVSGAFVWTGIGYRGEPGYKHYPNVLSSYGIMDICCFPKDQYYMYQSAWTNKPVLHLMPHWNWKDSIGKSIKVWVYSNCNEVELLLNEKSLGKQKTKPLDHLEWNVTYKPGKLTAKGYINGILVKEDTEETTGEPAAIQLAATTKTLQTNGRDVAIINFSVVDEKGRIVPEAHNEINFQIAGEGRNIGIGSGDPVSEEPDHSNKRKVFKGLGQILIQSTRKKGRIIITASSIGLRSKTIFIN